MLMLRSGAKLEWFGWSVSLPNLVNYFEQLKLFSMEKRES